MNSASCTDSCTLYSVQCTVHQPSHTAVHDNSAFNACTYVLAADSASSTMSTFDLFVTAVDIYDIKKQDKLRLSHLYMYTLA